MKSNKFTKEQFLLLAECEYVFCDNVEKFKDMYSGKAEGLKAEVLTLGKRAEEILPDSTEEARERIKVGSLPVRSAEGKAMALLFFENEIARSKKGGLFAIICLYDELKKAEKGEENESNS